MSNIFDSMSQEEIYQFNYSAFLPFYEDVLLRKLQASGCRNNILMMDASMLSHSNFVLESGLYGDYQVQITWTVKIYNYWVYGVCGYDYMFTLSENYYLNCQYVEL